MPPRSSRLDIKSRSGKTAITLFALGLISCLTLPHSVWNMIQPLVRAASFTVNTLADTSDAAAGNGICADAGGMCSLRAAMQEANVLGGDDTINFSITGTINLTGVLPDITSNMTINGPGSSLLSIRRDTGGDYRIFSANNRNVNITGLTVTNGRTPDSTSGGLTVGPSGGGILQSGGVMVLTDVVITGNSTGKGSDATSGSSSGGLGGFGGGISASGTLTMTKCVVSANRTGNGGISGSGGRGGGIWFGNGTITLQDVVITDNHTGNSGSPGSGNSGYGGGIWTGGEGFSSQPATATMTNVTITNNTTGTTGTGDVGGGAGVFIMAGTATLTNSTVSNNHNGNSTSGGGGSGGGVFNNGTLTITNSLVSGNSTGNGSFGGSNNVGGGISNNFILTVLNSTISGNSTGVGFGRGGGIYNGGTLTLTNSTVTRNITHANTANGIVGGSSNTVGNSIIAGNGTGGNGPDHDPGFFNGTLTSRGHNLIGNGDGGTGFNAPGDQVGTGAAPLNPQLGPLADNGGPTLTHSLLAGSPALDSGSNSVATDGSNNPLVTDQRGAGRVADSPDAGTTATVDIGAFEFHQTLENVQDGSTNEDTPLSVSFALGDTGVIATSTTATSNNQALIPDANLIVTGTGSVRTLLITSIANLSGVAQITLSATYSGGAVLNDTFLLTVNPVNDIPTFTKGADQTVNEDAGPQSIANWATGVSAGPNESAQTLTFQVTAVTPALFSAGPAISDTGTLTYTPAPNTSGTSLIIVGLKDNGGTSNGGQDTAPTQTFSINVTSVNDVPTFTKGADQTVNEDPGFQSVPGWATGIGAGSNESQFVFFQVTGNTNPTLFSSAPSVSSNGTLGYSPASNASGAATITIVLKDTGGTTNGGQDTSAPQTFNITVTAVNDAPINSLPFSQSTNQNTSRVFSPANFNAITVSDVDAGTDAIRITLNATQGTITLGSTAGVGLETGDGTDDVTMTFSGAITAINTALNGLTFKPNTNFSGSASIQVTTDDLGHNGSGGAKSDTDTIVITVRAGGAIQFVNATYEAHENFGVATITVSRSGGGSGAGSVNYATSNGTAIGGATCGSVGADYRSASGTLSWANLDSSTKSFDVLFCSDSQNEANETINLVLSSPTGTITLGTTASATLTILNDDAPILLTVENTERALALDLVTQMTEPFSLTSDYNLSTDQRRRISLFVWRLGLLFGDTAGNLTVLAEDDQGGVYNLPVESVVPLAGSPDVTQVVVRLPDNVIGAPTDLRVSVSLRGPGSNKASIQITSP